MIILLNNILHPIGKTFSLHSLPKAVVFKPNIKIGKRKSDSLLPGAVVLQ